MTFSVDKSKIHGEFLDLLDKDQIEVYSKIVKERRSIYYQGFSLGLLLSLIIIIYNYITNSLENKLVFCVVGSITFVVQYFYYILSKKTDWMILHLKTKKQIEGWLKVYKIMQNRYHMGLVLGIVSLSIFSIAFRREVKI